MELPGGIGKDTITINKNGVVTEIKVKVTAQNGLDTEEYTIAILEKSANSNLDILKVNGVIINPKADGSYYTGIKNNVTQIKVEAIAEDTYARTSINTITNNTYIAEVTENVVDGKTIYNYTIVVTAEDGTESEYNLTVECLEANTNIAKILVGETELDLNEAVLQADGTYYYKINRVEEGFVSVELESDKSTVSIDGGAYIGANNGVNPTQKVALPNEKNIIIIKAKGQDETIKEYTLIIEKKSLDTEVLSITGNGVISTDLQKEFATVYVNEELNSVDLTITLKSDKGSLKLKSETDYELNNITRTIDLSDYDREKIVVVTLSIKAEDGTQKEYVVNISKRANVGLATVVVNSETLTYDAEKGRYEKLVSNGNKPEIVITASDLRQKVELLDIDGNVLATGTGSITTTQTLLATELTTKYVIKVTSHKGEEYGVEEYDLWITQKSTETGITYIKVESLGTILSEDKLTYSSTVSRRGRYPVEIKLKDENAEVRVEDLERNILIDNQTGTLKGELEIISDETKEFKVIVTSQNGEEKEYKLNLDKVQLPASTKITSVKVNSKEAENGEEENTFVSYIYDSITTARVEITAENEKAEIIRTTKEGEVYLNEQGESIKAKGYLTMDIETLENLTTIYFKVIAENGEESEVQTLNIEKMNTDTTLKEVYVDGILITPDENGRYEANVLDTNTNIAVKAITTNDNAYLRILLGEEALHIKEQEVSLSSGKETVVPITVRSQSGITKVTYLYINKLSTSLELDTVTLDDKEADYYNKDTHTYRFLVDSDKTEFSLFIMAESDYTILEYNGKEYTASLLERLSMEKEIEGMSIKVKAKSEVGTEREYTIEIARKSDNVSLSYLKVNGKERMPDVEDGDTYTVGIRKDETEAEIEIMTEYSYAEVKIGDNEKVLRYDKKKVDCSNLEDSILVPVVVTAADGTTIKTYNIILVRQTLILGKITTENIEGKHIAQVKLYRRKENEEEDDVGEVDASIQELIVETQTKEDGTYEINISEAGVYEVVIEKEGYLSYKVKDIQVEKGDIIELEEYALIGGDVAVDGEIEINDLVDMNRELGKTITDDNRAEIAIYDLNGDGTIDLKDRKILKDNYGKTAEEETWVNPNPPTEIATFSVGADEMRKNIKEENSFSYSDVGAGPVSAQATQNNFILPIASTYTVTSEYGTRTHPIDKTEKMHHGIDLVGTHHTEILAVADGVVTFAGVQNGYGNCIEIKHTINGKTVYSFYAHLSEISTITNNNPDDVGARGIVPAQLKPGDKITKGQVIGLQGGGSGDPNPGTSTGEHLHFELRTASGSGHTIDPRKYIEF